MTGILARAFVKAAGTGGDLCSACGGHVPWTAGIVALKLGDEVFQSSPLCPECGQPRDWETGKPKGYPTQVMGGSYIVRVVDDVALLVGVAQDRAATMKDADAEERLGKALDALREDKGRDPVAWSPGLGAAVRPWLGEEPPAWSSACEN